MADQARRSIHEELLTIPGIAGAEFDGDPSTPEGVRVQLAPGADPDHIGREVRRVLAGHGMRSQLTAPAVAPRVAPPPPEPRTVLNLADFDQFSPADPDEAEAVEEGSAVDEAGADESAAISDRPPQPDAGGAAVLEHVAVAQRKGGIAVTVALGGHTAERVAVATEDGIDRALLSAVSALLGRSPEPALVRAETHEIAGSTILIVLLDDGSRRYAGSAVVRGNRPWAAAYAMWSALSEPA